MQHDVEPVDFLREEHRVPVQRMEREPDMTDRFEILRNAESYAASVLERIRRIGDVEFSFHNIDARIEERILRVLKILVHVVRNDFHRLRIGRETVAVAASRAPDPLVTGGVLGPDECNVLSVDFDCAAVVDGKAVAGHILRR